LAQAKHPSAPEQEAHAAQMARRCFCCTWGKAKARQVVPSPENEDEVDGFSPTCTCKAFRDTGACKHIPPALPEQEGLPSVVRPGPPAPAAGEFVPQCTCQAFRQSGSCKHLPPALAEGGRTDEAQDRAAVDPGPHAGVSSCRPLEPAVLPDLDLPPFPWDLRFGEILGRGASGTTVFRCVAIPQSAENSGAAGGARASEEVPCAAKVLPLGLGTFPDMVEEFGGEVDLLRGVQHEGVVAFVGACRLRQPPLDGVADAYVLCLELFDVSLEAVIRERRRQGIPFLPVELGHVLLTVAGALSYLHGRRILHRDVKAANVFLRRAAEVPAQAGPPQDGPRTDLPPLQELHVKLGDLGAAKAASRAQTPVQTPAWMAPEAMRQEDYGPAADIWGLGMLAYELLELGPPFGPDITFPELEAALVEGRRPGLSSANSSHLRVPWAVALMERCLSPLPGGRPTADEVVKHLEEVRAAGWPGGEADAPAST